MRANLLALERDHAVGAAHNVGPGLPDLPAMVAALRARLGGPAPELAGRFRQGDIRHCFADTGRASERLGFEARVAFEDGIVSIWRSGRAIRSPRIAPRQPTTSRSGRASRCELPRLRPGILRCPGGAAQSPSTVSTTEGRDQHSEHARERTGQKPRNVLRRGQVDEERRSPDSRPICPRQGAVRARSRCEGALAAPISASTVTGAHSGRVSWIQRPSSRVEKAGEHAGRGWGGRACRWRARGQSGKRARGPRPGAERSVG